MLDSRDPCESRAQSSIDNRRSSMKKSDFHRLACYIQALRGPRPEEIYFDIDSEEIHKICRREIGKASTELPLSG